ncbi:hypothetical protein [Klugiella xanthotipulae]|uniref:Uncharacterized protein n=1 Tax=Klugiella xanthotipulae TaxID=244735 RepID=A0A543I4X7_9MICO|nr:hypothetical protein [Klugiella xanthotipulae]TQM65614.1 hypothetical protein FB466_0420 [Klugiella xanthotipulae]
MKQRGICLAYAIVVVYAIVSSFLAVGARDDEGVLGQRASSW